jgi:hypothetical protein
MLLGLFPLADFNILSLFYTFSVLVIMCQEPVCSISEPSTNGNIYNILQASIAQETLQKKSQKDCKIQKIKELPVRLCLLVMSEVISIKSSQHDYPNMN